MTKRRKKPLDSGEDKLLIDNHVPDPDSNEYYYDEVDEFHLQQEKVLLDRGMQKDQFHESDNEEEVLPVVSEDDLSDDDEVAKYREQLRRLDSAHVRQKMGSDIEDSDDGLPDSSAWGSRRSQFYGTDVVDDRIDLSGSEDDEGRAALEEKEALAIQKKMAEELDDQDFGLDVFKPVKLLSSKSEDQEKIVKDLSKLTKRDKLELLQKESPELITLIQDFINKMTELRDVLQPLLQLTNEGKLTGKEAKYVTVKFQLCLNYCVNVSFYLMLKAKHVIAHSHPVVKRLVQYRNLMKELESVDEKLKPQITDILERIKNGETIDFGNTLVTEKQTSEVGAKKLARKRKNAPSVENLGDFPQQPKMKKSCDSKFETKSEKEALAYYQMMKDKTGNDEDQEDDENMEKQEENADEDNENQEDGEKRGITYEMSKNKGLTAHKKKEGRNPRVKLKMKFKRANIRRKGQIREVKSQMQPYGGEHSGIRAGVKRGIRLK